jgi:hypothetical protein
LSRCENLSAAEQKIMRWKHQSFETRTDQAQLAITPTIPSHSRNQAV